MAILYFKKEKFNDEKFLIGFKDIFFIEYMFWQNSKFCMFNYVIGYKPKN
ncbi:hypothetical protein NE172_01075 [Clostridium botulinum]|nr:hypothetical protein [Clostridium botulinum]HBZ6635421.1 hypothetical protein [Clostridium botulinum]HBZ7134161.1 hypothetical protein [Clostridium botulinum]